ncbi:MAG: M15 family metallopeptidase, partial [Ramlibacter sp.]
RYIAYDPAKGLSLHTWGIAIDLNVPENQRGTVGRMNRQVVQIFKRWGFAWGGDWHYTDPMHFELAKVVRAAG